MKCGLSQPCEVYLHPISSGRFILLGSEAVILRLLRMSWIGSRKSKDARTRCVNPLSQERKWARQEASPVVAPSGLELAGKLRMILNSIPFCLYLFRAGITGTLKVPGVSRREGGPAPQLTLYPLCLLPSFRLVFTRNSC